MKRDFELIRKLLIFFREKEGPEMVKVPQIDGYSDLDIKYHCVLLYDAGFLRCEPMKSSSNRVYEVWPFDLTWQGHEFADKILDEKTWAQIKETISGKGSVLAFGVINGLATKFAMKAAGLES